jgi:hypothetical protein
VLGVAQHPCQERTLATVVEAVDSPEHPEDRVLDGVLAVADGAAVALAEDAPHAAASARVAVGLRVTTAIGSQLRDFPAREPGASRRAGFQGGEMVC